PAQSLELGRRVRTDVERGRARHLRESAGAHGEDHELAGRTGGYVEELRARVEAGERIDDLAHALAVLSLHRVLRRRGDVRRGPVAALELVEDVGGIVTEFDAEVVDEFESALLGDAGEDRMLRERRTLADLAAAGVVGDAADDRGPDRGRADDRMRFATERGERLVEFVEGGSGQAHGLASVVDEVDLIEPQGRDDDDLAVVVLRAGPGTAGQAGVG